MNTGGIVGANARGELSNCFNLGIVKSEYYGAGGIAGNNEAIIRRCYNNAAISAYSTVGGIVGSNASSGKIENTYNVGIITATNNMAGGIGGGNEGAIYNSYNCQNIIAASQSGAICGFISKNAVLDSCFSSGDKFEGKLTFRGNDYPNSAILRDREFAHNDSLINANFAKALSSGKGIGVWTKRGYDEAFCYYPELSIFNSSADSAIVDYSRNSIKIIRYTPEVSLSKISYVYDGESHEPNVYCGEEKLTINFDYTVSFSNNLNVGAENGAIAEITFINYFKGNATKYFSITKQPITVKWSQEKFVYTGKVQHPTITIETGRINDENITFEYLYDSNIDIGKHSVKVQLEATNAVNNNYHFEPETIKYEIFGTSLTLDWNTDVLYYNGTAQYPQASIESGIKEFDSVNLIYSEYENNINAQSGYTVKVTCDNKNYCLDVIYTYSVEKRPISAVFEIKDFYYTGIAQFPKISKVNNTIGNEKIVFEYGGYENNISAKKGYTVTAVLADTETNANYILSETIGIYKINRQMITASFSETPLVYNGKPQCPVISSYSGVVAGESVIFELSDYSMNINATQGKTYSVIASLDSDSLVNSNYVFEPVTYFYGIEQAEIKIDWDESSLPLIYNSKPQHPTARVISKVFDDRIELLYGECNNVNVGKNYSISIESENSNYIVVNVLEYEIEPMILTLSWVGESNLIYNGTAQHPKAGINAQICDRVELIYGVCNNVNIGQNYSIEITSNNTNYTLINGLTYSILPKRLNVIWEDKILTYNGRVQYPKASIEGAIQGENISLIYLDCADNFDVGIQYTVGVALDECNALNLNYVLNDSQTKAQYRINKKSLELINIKAVDREYNGNTAVDIEGGELMGMVSGDNVSFIANIAAAMSATAGENKAVMFMPSLLGEHAYRYRIIVPEITVNIYKANVDTSGLGFNNLAYLYDGNLKNIQLQGDLPKYIKYEISGNKQTEVGEYYVKVHFIYNEANVEPISDIEEKWYIAASEYLIYDKIKIEILSGMIEYGATAGSEEINSLNEELLSKNKECLGGYKIAFYKDGKKIDYDGTVRISLMLGSEMLNKPKLLLYELSDGELKEIEFEIVDSRLVFITDNLSEFYIVAEIKNNALWIGLGVAAGVVIVLLFLVLLILLRKKKRALTNVANLPNIKDETVAKFNIIVDEQKSVVLEPADKDFVIDGVYCRSYQSFLASLNYKDFHRQKEICSFSADKANRFAAGKGNGKRKDLYWQGKRIIRGSNEYYNLIERVKLIINSNDY